MWSSSAIGVRSALRAVVFLTWMCVVWVGGAWAQPGPPAAAPAPSDVIQATLMVTHFSNRDGGIDPRARGLSERLQRQNIRYPSARVLLERRAALRLEQVETLALPDGRSARFRPIHVGAQGVLMAVDVERAVKMDARVRRGHMLVIDAGRFEDGKLVISVEPD
ncbi:MAG: hypothetical protein OEM49_01415 [Myxococcales bacterium]|nr:hypothetical protein [Myxococcales bacterium]MDH5305563.1 hypothetical protein [Myxococcales bacterium]MDH5565196.1 hypothetical protein [Myxococcales bacterium]